MGLLRKLCEKKAERGLGFRNFKAFNLALLAKQFWRLVSNKESVLFKVLNSKYFVDGDVFQARLGSRSSFVWRSIFSAKEVVETDSRWRIKDGATAKV